MPQKKELAFPEIPAELKPEDWWPMEPDKGPPLPKWLNIFWPWYKPEVPPVYTCPYCGAEFATQDELNQHIASAHPEQPPVYTCPYCGAIFSSQTELDAHIQAQHPPITYTCPHCGATFNTEEELNYHIQAQHPTAPNIILENLVISPASVEVGQKVIITLTANNIGNAAGSKIVVCGVDSSTAQQSISLESGASIDVTFETTPTEVKTYTVTVDGLTGSFVATAPPVISAEITDAYVFDKDAETSSLWNGYAHISLPYEEGEDGVSIDWTRIASRDTVIGFILVNNSEVAVAFNFRLWQYQWTMINSKQKYITIDLIPTSAAPIPMENGIYQADKVLVPGDILGPGQKGFMAAPATIGRRWCTFNCTATYNGKSASGMVKGWGGY